MSGSTFVSLQVLVRWGRPHGTHLVTVGGIQAPRVSNPHGSTFLSLTRFNSSRASQQFSIPYPNLKKYRWIEIVNHLLLKVGRKQHMT